MVVSAFDQSSSWLLMETPTNARVPIRVALYLEPWQCKDCLHNLRSRCPTSPACISHRTQAEVDRGSSPQKWVQQRSTVCWNLVPWIRQQKLLVETPRYCAMGHLPSRQI